MKEIALTQGKVALVDDDDFERINQCKWFAWRGYGQSFYATRSIGKSPNQRRVWMHREILTLPHGVEIDHRDRNGLNNQRSNLRAATRAQNAANLPIPVTNTSGLKGVSWHAQSKSWCSTIHVNGKKRWLGTFSSKVAAALRYDKEAILLRGDFAAINFPNAISEQNNSTTYMAKQSEIPMTGPGVESPSIKAVDEAFENLLAARSKRMKFGEQEKEAQQVLIDLFHKHDFKVYNFEDKTYQLVDIEKVKLLPREAETD